VAAPVKWGVFAEFHRERGDEGKRFLFQVELQAPNGVPVIPGQAQIFLMTSAFHRLNVMYNFFPLVAAGEYNLIGSIKGDQEAGWKEVGRYPITIAYTTQQPAINPTTKG
jgi:hypothetical protein